MMGEYSKVITKWMFRAYIVLWYCADIIMGGILYLLFR